MDRIRHEPEDKCLYKRLYFPYTVGLNKIFTTDEIEPAERKLASFEKEFNLQFTAGFAGVFDQLAVDECIKLGDYIEYNFIYQDNPTIAMGIDFGFGSSNTAITITPV